MHHCQSVTVSLRKTVRLGQSQVTCSDALDFTKHSWQDEHKLPEVVSCKAGITPCMLEKLIGSQCVLSLVCSWFNVLINWCLLMCSLRCRRKLKLKCLWKWCIYSPKNVVYETPGWVSTLLWWQDTNLNCCPLSKHFMFMLVQKHKRRFREI